MKRLTKCSVLSLCCVSMVQLCISMTSIASEVQLGLSSTLAPNTCLEIAADNFRDQVAQKSKGRIEIIRYPSGELYNPKSEIEAVAKGAVDMGMLHVAYVGMRSPTLEFISSFGACGVWEDNAHYWRFLDLPEVREIASQEFEKKLHAKLLGIVSYGTSVFGTSVSPVHKIEDYKNIKVRTAGKAQALMYKTLGAVPVEISSNEIYMALQRGTIDAATSGPSRFRHSKWYEVTPYITQDNTLPYLSFWLAINLRKWNSLSEEDKALLQSVARDTELWTRKYVVKETKEDYTALQNNLIKELYFMPNEETMKIKKLVEPVMHQLAIDRMGQAQGERIWNLLEQTRQDTK